MMFRYFVLAIVIACACANVMNGAPESSASMSSSSSSSNSVSSSISSSTSIFSSSVFSSSSVLGSSSVLSSSSSNSGKIVFTPAKFPCDYQIVMEESISGVNMLSISLYVRGDYIYMLISNMMLIPLTGEIVTRPDMKYVEDNVTYIPVFTAETAMGKEECVANVTRQDELREAFQEYIHIFYENATFDRVSDGTFEGVKCKVYERDDESKTTYYVNADNYIIGIKSDSFMGSSLAKITYKMECPLKVFVINKSQFPDCNSSAYKAPDSEYDMCDASSIRAVFLIVLAAIALCLF